MDFDQKLLWRLGETISIEPSSLMILEQFPFKKTSRYTFQSGTRVDENDEEKLKKNQQKSTGFFALNILFQ